MAAPVGVVDYAAGNSSSVMRALWHLSIPARLVSRPDELVGCSRVVLPGVGSAGSTMSSLRSSGMAEALTEAVRRKVPYVGICIGLQVLFEHSDEDDTDCLGWLPGTVRRLPGSVRVPQIGWNLVEERAGHPSLEGAFGAHFYFVNSFVAVPDDDGVVAAESDYGGPFPAAIHSGNIFATQFHLEKSGPYGLSLLSRVLSADVSTC